MMNKLIKKSVLLATTAFFVFPAKAEASYLKFSEKGSNGYHLVSTDIKGQRAQEFVDKMGGDLISLLKNNKSSKERRALALRKFLKINFDMQTIGRFSMGRYWKTATKAQQAEYQRLFEAMIVDVYSDRLGEYKGEKIKVLSHRANGKKDFLVNSAIVPNSGSKIKVDWRVRNKNGRFKIIDVIIEGVSMSLNQRSDFSSVIQRGGGDVEILLDHLRK